MPGMAAGRRPAVWSADSRADLDEIWRYYERTAGRKTAEKIARQIGQAVLVIEEHQLAGRARNEIRPGLRSLAATPHVVFYRIANNRVEIVRVLDGRQDIDKIFSD